MAELKTWYIGGRSMALSQAICSQFKLPKMQKKLLE